MSGKDYSAKLANLANYDIWNFAVVKAEIPGSLHRDIDVPAERWLRILCTREGGFKRVKAIHAARAGHAICKRVVLLPLKRVPAGRFEHIWEGGNWSRPPVCYALWRIRKPERGEAPGQSLRLS